MESPVPASMFAPEPSSPGAARAAAAAARLHGGFDSDCSEDGEALNGEPELDLTSKVGPGGGGGGGARGTRAGRTVTEATAGSWPSSGAAYWYAGKTQPAHLPRCRTCGARAHSRHRAVSTRPPALSAPASIAAPWLRHVEPGSQHRPRALHPCPYVGHPALLRRGPRDTGFSSFWSVPDDRGSRWLGQGAGCSRRQVVSHSEVNVGWQLLLFLVPGKETESSCSVGENDVRGVSTFRVHPNSIKRWD